MLRHAQHGNLRIISATLLSAFFFSGAAFAADGEAGKAPPHDPPADAAKDSDDLLAGPKVEDDAAPAPGEKMMPAGEGQRRGQRQVDLQFRRWMEIIRGQDLSEEQTDKIREIANELQRQTQEFQQNPENRELMKKVREARESGSEPPVQAREKMQQLEANRPKPEAYQQRIWAVLTPQQQDAAKAEMDEARKQLSEQQRTRRTAARGPEGQDGAPPAPDEMGGKQPEPRDAARPNTGNTRAPGAPDRARRRGAAGENMDDMAKRRANFLKSRQAGGKQAGRPGATTDNRTDNKSPRSRDGGNTEGASETDKRP